jgi:L-alanine-DL-glutamate epimerase-like enolase superfamily enzyme
LPEVEETMKRRHFLAAAPAPLMGAPAPASAPGLKIVTRTRRLMLAHTWTTVMSSSEYRDTFFVELAKDGITGIGEGAPIVRYKESAETCTAAIESIRPWLEAQDPFEFARIMKVAFEKIPGDWAGKAALDIALLDWVGKRLGIPVWRYFGLSKSDAPVTTFSIGIDKAEVVRQKVREAAAYPVLKVKVGLDNDEEVIGAVRSATNRPIRADANEGFKSKEQAVEKINWLAKNGVEFIEQPLPAANLEDMNWIRKRVSIPIIADEACLHPADIPRLAPHFDGVNVKVDKAGGLLEAWRMIQMARSLNLKVMLGCMVSSSAAVTAAAQLSPMVDYADLDGNLLISNDPYDGVKVENGKLILPDRPGIGLKARPA